MRRFLRLHGRGCERLLRLEAVVEVLPMVALEGQEAGDGARYRGALRFRGALLPVLEIADGAPEELAADWLLVVVEAGPRRLALVARSVDEVLELPAERVHRLATGDGEAVESAEVDGRVLRVLEPATLVGARG